MGNFTDKELFAYSEDEFGEDFDLPDGDREPFQQMTFTLADEQAEQIKNSISNIKQSEEYKYIETFGNENSNGNVLYLIISYGRAKEIKLKIIPAKIANEFVKKHHYSGGKANSKLHFGQFFR